jgi:hypothetical protein
VGDRSIKSQGKIMEQFQAKKEQWVSKQRKEIEDRESN